MSEIDLTRSRPERSKKRRGSGKGAVTVRFPVRLDPELKASLEKEAAAATPPVSASLLINMILEERYSKG